MSDDDEAGDPRGMDLMEIMRRFTWRTADGVLMMNWTEAERAQAQAQRTGDETIH